MTHRGPFQLLTFCVSVILGTVAWSLPYFCWPHYSWYKSERPWPS